MLDLIKLIPFLARFTNNPKKDEKKRDKTLVKQIISNYLSHFFTWIVKGALKVVSK